MFKNITYLFLLLFIGLNSFGQNDYPYGNINVRIFDSKEYNAESQNWDITQTEDNLIVIANNKSILLYDGVNWIFTKLKNKGNVRSVRTVNGLTYVGGAHEFGKLFFDSSGTFSYKPLSTNLNNTFRYTLKAFNTANFVSKNEIFTFRNDSAIHSKKFPKDFTLKNAIEFENKIICYSKKQKNANYDQKNCLLYNGKQFYEIKNSSDFNPKISFKKDSINYLISSKGLIREIITSNNNFKLENTTKIVDLKTKNSELDIFTISIRNNIIAVGTDGDGIYLFKTNGQLIRHINKSDGLKNLQIRKLYFDQANNLWAAVDNGIYLIDLSNPITQFGSQNGITSIIEDIHFNENEILLLTHDDLYRSSLVNSKIHFKNSNLFRVELWKVKEFTFSNQEQKTMFVSNNGIEILKNDKRKIINNLIVWDMEQSPTNPDLIWYALDDGIGYSIYHPKTNTFTSHLLKNTSGQVRDITEFENDIYYTVTQKGIVKLDSLVQQSNNLITEGLKPLNDTTLTYSDFTLSKFQNKLYIGTNHGLYYLNNLKYTPVNNDLTNPKHWVFRLYNDNNQRLWMVSFDNTITEKELRDVGYIEFNNNKATYTTSPFTTLSNDVIQVIKDDNNGKLWFGGKNKAYIFNEFSNLNTLNSVETLIHSIRINDSLISNYTKYAINLNNRFDWGFNTITFNFACPNYSGETKNTYSTYLEGWDEKWSPWSDLTKKTYQKLTEGEYIFHVKSKNYYNSENKETIYSFTISPPWYRTIWAYILYFFITLLLIYIIIRLSLKRVKDQNEKLEKIVEERTAKVEQQKNEIEHKNRDIVDSIIYAKRIQDTILPTKEKSDSVLNDYFVIYKPKDIVSGDFYWIDEIDGKAYFSAIDCTGHGVPGAFVSIVGFNGIKRTVNEFKERQPSKILDKLADIVIDTFTATESHLKDGMDMSLCSLDYKTLELEFAGANNPLIIIRNGELFETKGNKQPIGDFEFRKPFTNHKIQLQKGDSIFIFTDGYPDQFGGPKGKKLKLKTLKNIFIEIHNLSILEQQNRLENDFNNWKGELEQLDDVCLIGLKI